MAAYHLPQPQFAQLQSIQLAQSQNSIPSLQNSSIIESNEKKEEKIAAARQRLKQFKKESKVLQSSSHQNGFANNNNNISNHNNEHNSNHLNLAHANEQIYNYTNSSSGRSTPSSINSSSHTNSQVYVSMPPTSQPQNVESSLNDLKQQTLNLGQTPANSVNSQTLSAPLPPQPHLPTTSQISNIAESSISQAQFKEQLQLHVQTIGILVAEKAELQSKLQQTTKKCDKKQDECDELMGRLKASRQKISDLEKAIQQQQTLSTAETDSILLNKVEIEKLKSDLNSNQLLVDELNIRLSESNEKLALKQQETQRIAQQNLELKSQLELLNLKVTQFKNNEQKQTQDNQTDVDNQTRENMSQDELNNIENLNSMIKELNEKNAILQNELSEGEKKLKSQREQLKSEYETYVSQFQHQIESLVDQINRMSDEREDSFAKIDRLEQLLNKSNKQNEQLNNDLNEFKSKYESMVAAASSNPNLNNNQATNNTTKLNDGNLNKEQLLENEIKYFKQQIEILVNEHNNLVKLLEDRELSINNLKKLLENYEKEREQHNKLLEQMHSDKQTLSRAIQQNKELKEQLTELQDAYVKVTQQNLELTTQLQAEQFKLKQINAIQSNPAIQENTKIPLQNSETNTDKKESSTDWGDDDGNEADAKTNQTSTQSEESVRQESEQKSTLMQSIKQRIVELENENKDLNDYISLMNQKLKEKIENDDLNRKTDPNSIYNLQVQKINSLIETINHLESERTSLKEELARIKLSVAETNEKQIQSNDSNYLEPTEENLLNFKLLEDKFTKVMKDNADLKEKNQELEHIILQLQFETETIIDYITMYQMEREKLNQKYKLKDESIRSLSTQLQVNKLALHEIMNYLNAYLNISQKVVDSSTEVLNQDQEKIIENEDKDKLIETNNQTDDLISQNENLSNSNANSNNNEKKKQILLLQIKNLLIELTSHSSYTLNSVSSSLLPNSRLKPITSPNSQFSNSNSTAIMNNANSNISDKNNNQPNNEIDPKSISAFKSQIILCSSCYGDLFVV